MCRTRMRKTDLVQVKEIQLLALDPSRTDGCVNAKVAYLLRTISGLIAAPSTEPEYHAAAIKVAIFSQFPQALKQLSSAFELNGIRFLRYDPTQGAPATWRICERMFIRHCCSILHSNVRSLLVL